MTFESSGRIDVHSHLLPGIDDGCRSITDSIACARVLVANGYTHAFCTPHIWPNYPSICVESVTEWTQQLQHAYDDAGVNLRLIPGGEMNLHPAITESQSKYHLSFGLHGKHALIDIWCDTIPEFFEAAIRWLQSKKLRVILAHPERMKAVQANPNLADYFVEMGLLLQGNLQCFGDPPDALTRRIAEQYLQEGRYFLLGSDTHNPQSMDVRMNGLARAIEVAGKAVVDQLTITNPRTLIEPG